MREAKREEPTVVIAVIRQVRLEILCLGVMETHLLYKYTHTYTQTDTHILTRYTRMHTHRPPTSCYI